MGHSAANIGRTAAEFEWPPEYEAIFTRHNGGPGVELTFSRRASEDRRIDIKARNDEFLDHRPHLCREFAAGSDPLCTMFGKACPPLIPSS
jgi:hypothetical protein